MGERKTLKNKDKVKGFMVYLDEEEVAVLRNILEEYRKTPELSHDGTASRSCSVMCSKLSLVAGADGFIFVQPLENWAVREALLYKSSAIAHALLAKFPSDYDKDDKEDKGKEED